MKTPIQISATPAGMRSEFETQDMGRGRVLETFHLMRGPDSIVCAQFLSGKFMRADHSPGMQAVAEAWVKSIIATARDGGIIKSSEHEPLEAI